MKKQPTTEVWKPFSFAESSASVRRVKTRLLRGDSIFIEPIFADKSVGYLVVVYDSEKWSMEELISLSNDDGGLGLNELHGLAVYTLGVKNRVTELINETLDAGFTVCLIADVSLDRRIMGSYILRSSVSDNT